MMESAAYDIIRKEGFVEGKKEGLKESRIETAKRLLALGALTDEQIAEATDMSVEEVHRLKQEQ